MFERYSEKNRRVIFFARKHAQQMGSPFVETEHLLLGLLTENEELKQRFLPHELNIEVVQREIASMAAVRQTQPYSVDLPLTDLSKRGLAYCAEAAERLGDRVIDSEHMLLGLLRDPACRAAAILKKYGVDWERAWHELTKDRPGAAPMAAIEPPPDRETLHRLIDTLPEESRVHARRTLEMLQTWPPVAPEPPRNRSEFHQRMKQRMEEMRLRMPAGSCGIGGGLIGTSMSSAGESRQSGHFSFSLRENDAMVFETHRIHEGHELTLIERLKCSEDGKTLAYSQELQGPKKTHELSIEFDLS